MDPIEKALVDDQTKNGDAFAARTPVSNNQTSAITTPTTMTLATDIDAITVEQSQIDEASTKSLSHTNTRQRNISSNNEVLSSSIDNIVDVPVQQNDTKMSRASKTEKELPANHHPAPSLDGNHSGIQQHRQSEQTTPGAVRVAGINQQRGLQQESQLSIFSSVDNLQQGDEENATVDKVPSSRLVAEVVNEEELLHELLARRITSESDEHSLFQEIMSRRRPEVVAESVVSVSVVEPLVADDMERDGDDDTGEENKKRDQRACDAKRVRMVGCVFLAVGIVIAAIVAGILLSQSNENKQTPESASTPTSLPSQRPTLAPVSRLEAFQTLLVNQSVSTIKALNDVNTAPHSALYWIANQDQAKLNVTTSETDAQIIINRYIMAVMYAANGGKLWFNQSHFISPKSICDWHSDSFVSTGVFCSALLPQGANNASQVLELALENNSLSGSIPTELGKLAVLVHLGLGNNQFDETIPSELGQLGFLTNMDLSGNDLTGPLPTQLGDLVSIKDLVFDGNQITGTIPTQFGQLSSLTSLSLVENHIMGAIPTELGLLSRLVFLDLSYNAMSGTPPNQLALLPNLTSLRLNNNSFTGNFSAIFCTRSTLWSEFYADCLDKVECSCCTLCL